MERAAKTAKEAKTKVVEQPIQEEAQPEQSLWETLRYSSFANGAPVDPNARNLTSPHTVLQLQRTIGNQATIRLLGTSSISTIQRQNDPPQNEEEPEEADAQSEQGGEIAMADGDGEPPPTEHPDSSGGSEEGGNAQNPVAEARETAGSEKLDQIDKEQSDKEGKKESDTAAKDGGQKSEGENQGEAEEQNDKPPDKGQDGGDAPASGSTPIETIDLQTSSASQVASSVQVHVSSFQSQIMTLQETLTSAVTAAQKRFTGEAMQLQQTTIDKLTADKDSVISSFAAQLLALETMRTSNKGKVATHKSDQLKALDTSYKTHKSSMDASYTKQTKAVKTAGKKRADDMRAHGKEKSTEAKTTSTRNAARAIEIGETKSNRWKNDEHASEIREAAMGSAKKTSAKIQKEGQLISSHALSDGQKLGREIDKATSDIVAKMLESKPDNTSALTSLKTDPIEHINKAATSADTEIDKIVNEAKTQIGVMQTSLVAQYTKLIGGFKGLIQEHIQSGNEAIALAGKQRLTVLAESANSVIAQAEGEDDNNFEAVGAYLQDNLGSFSVYVSEASGELDAGVNEMMQKLQDAATQTTASSSKLVQTSVTNLATIDAQVKSGLEKTVKTAGDAMSGSVTEADKGMAKVVKETDAKLLTSVSESESKFDASLREGKKQINDKVDPALTKQAEHLVDLSTGIDEKVDDIRDSSWWDAIGDFFSFLGGFIMGLLTAVWKLIVGLFWLVVGLIAALGAILAIVAVIFVALVLFVGAELALAIAAVVGLVLLAVVALAAVGLIVYGLVMTVVSIVTNIYRSIMDPSLSMYERGKLFGEGVGDIVLLLLPLKAKTPKGLGGVDDAGRALGGVDDAGKALGGADDAGKALGGADDASKALGGADDAAKGADDAAKGADDATKGADDATKGADDAAKPASALDDVRSKLDDDAREGFDQQVQLIGEKNVNSQLNRFKRDDGSYDIDGVNEFYRGRRLTPEKYAERVAAQETKAWNTAQDKIKTIDDSIKETTPAGRPDATIGDGTSEAALLHETQTGSPVGGKGHSIKIRERINAIEDSIANLQNSLSKIKTAERRAQIQDAIRRGQERVDSMRPARDAWNNRVKDHPDVWNPDGTSKNYTDPDGNPWPPLDYR